ncbi:MAG: hypothetical protein ACO1N0_10175 [Fluviicola sp.]|jgi:hypothetical protein
MKEQIERIIAGIEKKHLNDPTVSNDLDEIDTLLSGSVEETIECLSALGENEISWISSGFYVVSFKLNDDRFISCIRALIQKYPDLPHLEFDVQRAIENMD